MRPRPWRSGIGSRLRALADVLDPVAAVDDEPREPPTTAAGDSESAGAPGFAGVDLSDAPEHWLRLVRNAGLVGDERTQRDVNPVGARDIPAVVSPEMSPGDQPIDPMPDARHAVPDAAPSPPVREQRDTSEVPGPVIRELSPTREQPRLNLTRSIYAHAERGASELAPTRPGGRPARVHSPAHRAPSGVAVSAGPVSPSTGTEPDVPDPNTPRVPVTGPIEFPHEARPTAPPVEQSPRAVELRTERPSERGPVSPGGSARSDTTPMSFSTPQVRSTPALHEVDSAARPSFAPVVPERPVPPVWPELQAPSRVASELSGAEVQVVLLERVDRLRREQRGT